MQRALAGLAIVLAACASGGPQVVYAADTPADLVALADRVFEDFLDAFPAQSDCIGTVEIQGEWVLDDRARYLPDSDIIQVRIPATEPHLTSSLVHELGHHLALACESHLGVRDDFAAAIGVAQWEGSWAYEDDPGELWAEAVVRHVTGRPDTRRILTVPPEAVAVVADWASS